MLSSPRNAPQARRGRDYIRVAVGIAAGALLLGLTGACGSGGDGALSDARTYEPVGQEIKWDAGDAERLRVSMGDFGGAGKGGGGAGAQSEMHWQLPKGWVELPPRQFREVNLRVAGDERAECYMSTLSGEGGGLESNVNRWRKQLSLPPLDAAAIAALPKLDWLGGKAVLFDFQGTWTGMSGDASGSNWRLVGLLLTQAGRLRTLKMVGPDDVIGRELEPFKAFVASFEEHAAGAHGQAGAAPAQPPVARAPDTPTPLVEPTPPSGAFTWTAPAGWTAGPPKSMREVTFFSGANNAVECYVALLAGDGGGILSNVNRWCGQLGAPTLSETDLAALKHEPVLGTQAAIVEIARGEKATAPANQEYLIGAVCLLSGRAVFVKMTGPRAEVEGQRVPFLEFCRSLKSAQ